MNDPTLIAPPEPAFRNDTERQIAELSARIGLYETQNMQLSRELGELSDSVSALQSRCAKLVTRLEQAEKYVADEREVIAAAVAWAMASEREA